MKSVKKLAADLAKLNEIRGLQGEALLNIGTGGVGARILNYAKCELERRLTTDAPENNDHLAEKLAKMTRIANDATAEAKILGSDLTRAGRVVSSLKSDNSRLLDTNKNLGKQIENLKTDLQSARDTATDKCREVTKLIQRIKDLSDNNHYIDDEYRALAAKHEDMVCLLYTSDAADD
jgi:chromosome segregation ATPase